MPLTSKDSRDFFSQVAQLFDTPIVVLDAERKVAFMNGTAEQFTGRSISEAAGAFFGEVLGLDAETCNEVCPEDPGFLLDTDSPWREFLCTLHNGVDQPIKIRRKLLSLSNGVRAVLLAVEGLGPWEQRYKDALAGAPVVFFEALADGRLIYGANQLADMLEEDAAALSDKTMFDLVLPEQKPVLREVWGEVLAGKQVRGREFSLVDSHGAAQPLWVSFFPVPGINRQAVGVRGTAIDLGEQKSLAYALESAEERFNVLFRESSDPILILSMSGDIMTANPSFESVMGIRSDELFCSEKSWDSFVQEDDLPLLQESIKRCAEGGHDDTVEFRALTAEGQMAWFEQSHSVLHNEQGRAKGIMAVSRDIDRRKQQERELRETAEDMERRHQRAQSLISKLKSFFARISALPTDIESFVNGVCDILFEMYRPMRVVVYVQGVQPRFYEVGRRLTTELVDDDARPLLSAMSANMVESGMPLYCNTLLETEPYSADRVVQGLKLKTYLGAPLRDSRGRIRGTLSLVDTETRAFDSLDVELFTVAGLHIAARLRAEEQEEVKQELEEHLQQAQKMEAVGMLAGGIAHDFNNILSGILGFSSFLLSKEEEGTELHRNLELIEQSAVRASDLTRQLLAFARRKHFAKEPVDVNKVVNEVFALLQRSLAKNIVIRKELADGLPSILGDPGQLNQVVMNLCLNGSEAMGAQGGTLRLRTAHRLLTGREQAVLMDAGEGEYVVMTVSDTGRGMSAEVQQHLFDPFFTTKSDRGGSGLGLSIVYGIVTNHGGDITVESGEGKGSVFKLYFPVHHGEVKKEEPPVALQLRGTETIMVVDDEAIVRQMVTAILKEYGYKVIAVSSGPEAVEMAEELDGRIHMVLLDMVMPGMDGEATFHALRNVRSDIPIMLTSGFAAEDRSSALIELGALGMIHKPYKSKDLLARLRQALTEHVWADT